MSKWVGYVEETVFDVNMLVINEKNVVVNNYNKAVFDALERYGVTPHICNFRHRYFWDGGLHCITSDLDREGEMKDYFPERG
jgi:glycine amidinotransferase